VILKANSFSHRVNECGVVIRRAAELDGSGAAWAWRETWDISARILNLSGNPKDIDSVVLGVEETYKSQLNSISLAHDDGTASAHTILAANTIGGIRVTAPPSFTNNKNGEGVTYRTYQVSIEALIPKRTGELLVYDLREKVDYRLGGVRYGFLEPNEGLPTKQMLVESAPWYATQSGVITGINEFLPLPDPIWPGDLLSPGTESRENPRKVGISPTGYWLYPVTYRFDFGSVAALIGNPTVW